MSANRAHAQDDLDLTGSSVEIQLHGFVSQGFLFTTDNDYLANSDRGSFEFTEVGLNVTATLTDRLRAGMQLFARDLGPIGDYRATMDWFHLDYRWQDWLGIRAGRVKLPFGLYNDTSDIDAARTAVLLPQSVYPASSRDFLLAQTGVELYGYAPLGGAGALDYRAYGGTIFLNIDPQPGSPIQVLDLSIPYVVGGRLLWETPLEGLRAGGSVQALRLDTDLLDTSDAMAPAQVEVKIPAILWVGSAEYTRQDLRLAAEYSRWHVDVDSSDPMVFPESSTVSERAYLLGTYRLTPLLEPGAYYSLLFPDVDDRSGRESVQHDIALTLRLDLNLYWLLKFETHYMHGTAALSPGLNDGLPREELEPNWLLFLAKTTAYF